MRSLVLTLTCTLLTAILASCGLVYHPPLQQGNLVDKKTVDQLKPGMTKRQVMVLMGSPAVTSPFDHDRWDYVRAFATNGGKMQTYTMTLYFNNDTLTRTDGTLFAADNQELLKQAKKLNASDNSRPGQPKGDKDIEDD